MKKSKRICLVLMGTLMTGVPACSESISEEQQKVFHSQAECVSSGISPEECSRMEAAARADSPKYGTREECEKQYGKEMCQGSQSGSWTPILLGFIAGQMMGNAMNKPAAVTPETERKNRHFTPATGLYNNPDNPGSYKTSKGTSLGRALSGEGALTKSIAPKGAISRGGFSGGRASS